MSGQKQRQQPSRRPSIQEVKSAARGQWPGILIDAGLPAECLERGGHPCPLCVGNDRFGAAKNVNETGAVFCRHCFNKASTIKPCDGVATVAWLMKSTNGEAANWIADRLNLTDTAIAPKSQPLCRSVPLRSPAKHDDRFAAVADRCHRAMKLDWWSWLEIRLGLPAAELIRLRVGWSNEYSATTWPMVDHDDTVVGVRLRCMKTGKKWSVPGGRAGLFVPSLMITRFNRLFITEGPTDCAAMLSLGFSCIGRPNCNGAVLITTKLVHRLHPDEVVIVADDDANQAGKRGAESLAVVLVTVCPRVRIIYPPSGFKDAREWVRHGATSNDVLSIVNVADVRSLSIKTGVSL